MHTEPQTGVNDVSVHIIRYKIIEFSIDQLYTTKLNFTLKVT